MPQTGFGRGDLVEGRCLKGLLAIAVASDFERTAPGRIITATRLHPRPRVLDCAGATPDAGAASKDMLEVVRRCIDATAHPGCRIRTYV
jgi:hypothetical protein